jgi:hypothetical protein
MEVPEEEVVELRLQQLQQAVTAVTVERVVAVAVAVV